MKSGYSSIVFAMAIIGLALTACHNEADDTPDAGGEIDTDTGSADTSTEMSSDNNSKPAPDFFDDIATDYIKLELIGLINPYDALEKNNITMCAGDVTASLGGERQDFNYLQYSLSFESGPIFPPDYYRDGDIFIRCASEMTILDDTSATWEDIRIGISREDLSGLGEHQFEMAMSPKHRVEYMTTQYHKRADGVRLFKTCLKATADLGNSDSKYFVDHRNNNSFAAGENFILWANIALTDDPTLVMNGPDQLCEYFILKGAAGSIEINEQQYIKEMENQFGFDCTIESDFFETSGDSNAAFRFKGVIFSADESPKTGITEMELQVDGKAYEVTDEESRAIQTETSILFQTLGSLIIQTSEHYVFDLFHLEIPQEKLMSLQNGEYLLQADMASGIVAAVLNIEQKALGSDTYIKHTPIAVIDFSGNNELFICDDSNTVYGPGEELQLAGNINLTSEPAVLQLAFPDGVFCEKNGASFPCDEFDVF